MRWKRQDQRGLQRQDCDKAVCALRWKRLKMKIVFVMLYLLWSMSAWLATVKYMTLPHWNRRWPYEPRQYEKERWLDMTWCELFWFALIALTPGSVAMNLYWLWVAYQNYRNKNEGRHMFYLPKLWMPKCRLPKCSVAIRGRDVE
jgi:hypothetical protein